MMLSEVALGQMALRYRADPTVKLKAPLLSVKGCGQHMPDPKGEYHEDHGCVIPMGKVIKAKLPEQSVLLYDEYMTYNVAQSKMRYLLRVKFHYTGI